MTVRYAAKRDGNEDGIIDALKARGFKVLRLDKFDLLVFNPQYALMGRPQLVMLEVKNPNGKDRGQSRTAQQKRIIVENFPLVFVETAAEAIAAMENPR